MTHRHLLDRIKVAQSLAELDSLMREGQTFENARKRTISRWKIHARKRRKELETKA